MRRAVIFFVFLALCVAQEVEKDEKETSRVCTFPSVACYEGSVLLSAQGNRYLSFQGIRFGKSPTGELRWQLPVAYQPEESLYDVTGTSDIKCKQFSWDGEGIVGTEDCLFLNVYVPEKYIDSQEKAPVLYWIYGGALVVGSNTYDEYGPNIWMDRDIIVVAVNYRLGALGFLSTVSEEIPGNLGHWDQALGLRWVNENIHHFGGDPGQVTLFGESAGSLSVSVLMVSPVVQGLFQRVIMDSGVFNAASYHTQTVEQAARVSEKLIKDMDCEGPDFLVCLQGKSDTEILEISGGSGYIETFWMPVPDFSYKAEPFLPDHPLNLLQTVGPDTQVMIGTTKDEGIIYLSDVLLAGNWEEYRDNYNISGTKNLFMIPFESDVTEADIRKTEQVLEFYVGGLEGITEANKYKLIDMFTDSGFRHGTYRLINQLVEQGVTVFAWILTHQGEHTSSDLYGIPPHGVCHADELLYMWSPVFFDNYEFSVEEDLVVQDQLVSGWSNFVKLGDPTPPGSNYSWSAVDGRIEDGSNQWYFNISGSQSAMDSSEEIFNRFKIWDQVLAQDLDIF